MRMLGSPSFGRIFSFLRAVSVVTLMRTEGESLWARVLDTGRATGKGDAMMSCASRLGARTRSGELLLQIQCQDEQEESERAPMNDNDPVWVW